MSTFEQTVREEHQEAECEHAMWLEDIGHWRSEHCRAAAVLAQAQSALREADAALESHAETVRIHEARIQRHERTVAGPQQDRRVFLDDSLGGLHQELQVKHDQAREAHQRIEAHHEMITTEVMQLSEDLFAPM